MMNHLDTYLAVGGMPEVLKTYLESRDWAATQERLQMLVAAYRADFGKYASRAQIPHLRLLCDAGLAHKCHHSAGTGVPQELDPDRGQNGGFAPGAKPFGLHGRQRIEGRRGVFDARSGEIRQERADRAPALRGEGSQIPLRSREEFGEMMGVFNSSKNI